MFKNQLQELAQRSCFNLPSYACTREGPDHAPRFKASVNFNGEIFESPIYCSTLRQAEHAAAEVALNVLSSRVPSRSLTARVLDETGIYKNLLQETAHRAGLNLPVYTTVRSGPGHVPVFTCTVELAGLNFKGEPAKTKKQAEKNAAIAAWSALKRMPNLDCLTNKEVDSREEQDQGAVARVLSSLRSKDEFRQARKRDNNYQGRRRIVKGSAPATSSSSSSSTANNSAQYHHRRLLDLLLDSHSSLDGSKQKQSSFLSLLPPPPPRATSQIFPPTLTRSSPSSNPLNRSIIPTQVRDKSQMKMQEIPVPLEVHQKDEEEWLGLKPEPTKKPIENERVGDSNSSSSILSSGSIYRLFPLSNGTGKLGTSLLEKCSQHESALISKGHFGPASPSPVASTSIRVHPSAHMSKPMHTGGLNPHRLAPAVQIRSVIPVCAAPPLLPTRLQVPSPATASASPSSTPTPTPAPTPQSTQTRAEVSVLNKTQSTAPTHQLSSEFNGKVQS